MMLMTTMQKISLVWD